MLDPLIIGVFWEVLGSASKGISFSVSFPRNRLECVVELLEELALAHLPLSQLLGSSSSSSIDLRPVDTGFTCVP